MSTPIDMFSGLAGAIQPPAREPSSAEEAGKQFEQMMAELMLKEMRKAMPEDSFFGSSELETFTELLDKELAARLVEGPGLGLKQQIAEAIERGRSRVVPGAGVGEGRWPVAGRLSSGFGSRLDPITGRRGLHPGLDIAAPRGTPVRAVRDGVVAWAGTVEGYGRVVYIDHGDGLETRYAHCQDLYARAGQRVRAGEPVATVGSSGRSTGPHLHFEARIDGEPADPGEVFSWKNAVPPQDISR